MNNNNDYSNNKINKEEFIEETEEYEEDEEDEEYEEYENEEELDDYNFADSLVIDAEKEGRYEFETVPTLIFFKLLLISAVILFICILGLTGNKTSRFVAPYYVWITSISCIIIFYFLDKGYSSKYYLDLNNKKLKSEYNLFSFHKEFEITDFSNIKLIGISTIITKEFDGNHINNNRKINLQLETKVPEENNKVTTDYNLQYNYEEFLIYGNSNKKIVLNRIITKLDADCLEVTNDSLLAASKIIGCKFIPSDNSNKIVILKGNPYDNIESLIKLVPREEQVPDVD